MAPVTYIPHDKNSMEYEFYKITTSSGKSVELTDTHMILSGNCDSELNLKMAKDVKVGFCFYTVDGWIITTTIIIITIIITIIICIGKEKVTEITTTKNNGIYTLVTSEELIVVNGIVASPYAV